MKLKEMIEKLRYEQTIEIRDENTMFICVTRTNSIGITPYMEMEAFDWFAGCPPLKQDIDFVVCVGEEQ